MLIATGYISLFTFKFKLINLETQSLGHTNHVTSAQQVHVADGFYIGQCRCIFPSLQKALLDTAALEPLGWNKIRK